MKLLDGVQEINFLGYEYNNNNELNTISKTYIFINKHLNESKIITDKNKNIIRYNDDLKYIILINKFQNIEYIEYDDNDIKDVYDLDYLLKSKKNILLKDDDINKYINILILIQFNYGNQLYNLNEIININDFSSNFINIYKSYKLDNITYINQINQINQNGGEKFYKKYLKYKEKYLNFKYI